MEDAIAIMFRKAIAEILDEEPTRCRDWGSVGDLLRQRFAGITSLVDAFLETERHQFKEKFKVRGVVNPQYLSREFGKRMVFLFLDARAISFRELQNLLKGLEGDVSCFNVYGDYDVVLKCIGAPEQIDEFAARDLRPRGADYRILSVEKVCIAGGLEVSDQPWLAPSQAVDLEKLNAVSKNFLIDIVSEEDRQAFLEQGLILGPVCIEDVGYTERSRALIGVTFLANFRRIPEFPSAVQGLSELGKISGLYQTAGEYSYLIEVIANDNKDLDVLTDSVGDLFNGVSGTTFVIARTVWDNWPSLSHVDIRLVDARSAAQEKLAEGVNGALAFLQDRELMQFQSFEPNRALSVLGLVQRLKDIDLSFLDDKDIFRGDADKNIASRFHFALDQFKSGTIGGAWEQIDSAMTSAGTALEGILKIGLSYTVNALFERKFEPRLRSRLNLPKGWWSDESRLTLEKILNRYAVWNEDDVLGSLFKFPPEVMINAPFFAEIRNRASHYSSTAIIEGLVVAEDAIFHAVRIAREVYERVLCQKNISEIQQERFELALVAAARSKDEQALQMLLENDRINVRVNEAVRNARSRLLEEGIDLRRAFELIEARGLPDKSPEDPERWTIEKIKKKWQDSGERTIGDLPNQVWTALWRVLEKVIEDL